MNYWHFQMSQPEGRNGIHVDSMVLLNHKPPLIGTGEWDSHQCENFKDTMEIGDILCVKDGANPIALCEVNGKHFKDPSLTEEYIHENFREVKILDFYKGDTPFPQPQGTLQVAENPHTETWQFINSWHEQVKKKRGWLIL